MPKFLIIRFSSIGDIIQCMGIIDGIREHFPDAEIHWIARKDMSSFLAMDKRIGKIWAFDKALGLKGLLKIFSIGVSIGFPGLSGVSFLTGNHF